MNKIALLLLALSSHVFAGTLSQNIQVTATVLPYCHVVAIGNQARNECFTNKSSTPITTTTTSQPTNSPAPVVVSKETIGETQRVTFYY
ncbi:hypothetical protein [Burkholderia sp. LMG 13014]|uniref:hypothetical protein n=1 Tax=Burkholderia sp. LMG 13014 TaxID=2709306 RepID=UPI0019666732|nr:hypothetical protein [Burkholderia sp. LMG 13014]